MEMTIPVVYDMFRFLRPPAQCFFFFNDTATTEIYTLSLHDALPISLEQVRLEELAPHLRLFVAKEHAVREKEDRKSTRLNSSHSQISYAVFCLKKKKTRSRDLRKWRQKRRLSVGVVAVLETASPHTT